MAGYIRPEHNVICDILRRMNVPLLQESECSFGGGTAIVLRYGEYRRSLDVDFLCHSPDGYRALRTAYSRGGPHALVPADVMVLRETADGYGIRMFLQYQGQPIKFEIVREGNIAVSGALDQTFGIPTLDIPSMFATKFLANADRWADKSTAYRDLIDLGMMAKHHGGLSRAGLAAAVNAYGQETISKGLVNAVNRLADPANVRLAADALEMDADVVAEAANVVRSHVGGLQPSIALIDQPLRRDPSGNEEPNGIDAMERNATSTDRCREEASTPKP